MLKLFILLLFLLHFLNVLGWINENRRIEEDILRNYDRRHRPVKQESTATQVQLFLTINHIEKVDQLEGTMLLHGVLWISWKDEYLQWNPTEYNNTFVISLETWKIWQPTFALYNSARSTSWFVYMNGVSATVSNDGKVVAAGTFTFQVTCKFDFSAFPYDVQECPIVLADWMYDNSKVNLSSMASRAVGSINVKPAVRLSFDPLSETVKKHVSSGLRIGKSLTHGSDIAFGLDNYWSLMEFGIKIKRHAPYCGLTIVGPMCITIILTLTLFWLKNLELVINVYGIILLLEAFSGWVLAQQIPPGDGIMPRIGVVHIWSVSLTLIALIFHCVMLLFVNILAPEFKFLPHKFLSFYTFLNHYKFFKAECYSFDPQKMGFGLLPEDQTTNAGDVLSECDLSPTMPPFQQNANEANEATIIQMDPIVHENEDKNGIGTSSVVPTQFDSIQLGVAAPCTSSSLTAAPLSIVPSTSKKAFSINLPLFGGGGVKNLSKKGIKSPFSTGAELFGSNEIFPTNEQQLSDSTSINAQLIVTEREDQIRQNQTDERGGITDGHGTDGQNGLKLVETARKTKKRSPLEQEFDFVRRLLFTLYSLVSAILMALLLI